MNLLLHILPTIWGYYWNGCTSWCSKSVFVRNFLLFYIYCMRSIKTSNSETNHSYHYSWFQCWQILYTTNRAVIIKIVKSYFWVSVNVHRLLISKSCICCIAAVIWGKNISAPRALIELECRITTNKSRYISAPHALIGLESRITTNKSRYETVKSQTAETCLLYGFWGFSWRTLDASNKYKYYYSANFANTVMWNCKIFIYFPSFNFNETNV